MNKRILFVEDDMLVGQMYARALENQGYKVDLQPTSEAAQKRLKEEKYDLILLDLLLPGRPGLEFLRELKAEGSPYKHLPVYILTNVDGTESIANGVALGIQGYFLKISTTPQKIIDTLNQFFRNQEEVLRTGHGI